MCEEVTVKKNLVPCPVQECIQVPVHYVPPCGMPPKATGLQYISIPTVIPCCPPPCCSDIPLPKNIYKKCECCLPKPSTIIPFYYPDTCVMCEQSCSGEPQCCCSPFPPEPDICSTRPPCC